MDEAADGIRLTVVGAGVMGTSIAALGVLHGADVALVDNDSTKLGSAARRVAQEMRLARFAGAITPGAALGEVTAVPALTEGAPATAVIEAVVEDAAVKAGLLAELSASAGPDVPLVTNTSSIPVDELAAGVPHPEALLGIHFMNPAYLVGTVEMIPGSRTSDATVKSASALLTALGRTGVVVGDGPGFVTSRISHRMINDAIKVVEEGRASAEDVDLLLQNCLGHSVGPLRTADLIGLDNLADSLAVLFERTHDESFRPAGLLLSKVSAGDHGRKSGRGFYTY